MRMATRRRLGFSGEGPETVVFHADKQTAGKNLELTNRFIASLASVKPPDQLSNGNLVWRGVPGDTVADGFFRRYRSPLAAWKVQGDAIAAYIDDRLRNDELVDWTVVLASSTDPDADPFVIGGQRLQLFHRGIYRGTEARLASEGKFSIKLLRSPTDEFTDLDDQQRQAALDITRAAWRDNPGRRKKEPATPVGWAVRRQRSPRHGLLVLYPVVPPKAPQDFRLEVDLTTEPIIGFLASFPHSPGAPTIEYQVNQIYNDLFFGALDDEDDDEDDM
jgi:hypothetical protein